MKRHINIEINRFTNFLKQGAFVRRQGIWTLLFNSQERSISREAESVSVPRATLRTDYLTSQVHRKHYENQWDMSAADFRKLLNIVSDEVNPKCEKIIIDWNEVDRNSFASAFEQSQQGIRLGEVKKVVPFTCQKGTLKAMVGIGQKIELLKSLVELPATLFPYGEWTEEDGFVGASPEIFFDLSGSHLKTMALAGTSGSEVESRIFLNDPKERKEHQFVIDGINQQLQELGKISISNTAVVSFPVLNHLVTNIQVDLKAPINADRLIEILHPTPALGIYPRNRFFEKFRQFPLQNEREFFGAPWGVETIERTFLLVAIRKLDWKAKITKIFAGCGVVQESELEKEFAEILKKIDSVKRIFFPI